MRFTLDRKTLDQFKTTGQITIESFFDSDKCLQISKFIESKIPSFEFKDIAMKSAHNLVAENPSFQKIINLHNLSLLAYELTQVKPIRVAYDQWLFGGMSTFDEERKSLFVDPSLPFSERFSVSQIETVLLIDLKKGDLHFFKPDQKLMPIALNDRYLLIVFSRSASLYQPCAADPMDSFLKKKGYVYGDRLKDNEHPLLLQGFNG